MQRRSDVGMQSASGSVIATGASAAIAAASSGDSIAWRSPSAFCRSFLASFAAESSATSMRSSSGSAEAPVAAQVANAVRNSTGRLPWALSKVLRSPVSLSVIATWYSRSEAAPTSSAKIGLAVAQRFTPLARNSQFCGPNSE